MHEVIWASWNRRVVPFVRLISFPANTGVVGEFGTRANEYRDGDFAVSLWRPRKESGPAPRNAATDLAQSAVAVNRSAGRRRTRGAAPRSRCRTAFLPRESWIAPLSEGSTGHRGPNPGQDASIRGRWFGNSPCELSAE